VSNVYPQDGGGGLGPSIKDHKKSTISEKARFVDRLLCHMDTIHSLCHECYSVFQAMKNLLWLVKSHKIGVERVPVNSFMSDSSLLPLIS